MICCEDGSVNYEDKERNKILDDAAGTDGEVTSLVSVLGNLNQPDAVQEYNGSQKHLWIST